MENQNEEMIETITLPKDILGTENYYDRLFIYEIKAKLYGGFLDVEGMRVRIIKGNRHTWIAHPLVIERVVGILNAFYNSNIFPRGLITEEDARKLASELRRWLLVEIYRLRCTYGEGIITRSNARILVKMISDHFFLQLSRSINGFGYDREKASAREITQRREEEIV